MQFDIITIFPHLFDSFLNESLIKKSIDKRLNKICVHDLRQWTKDKHKTVDSHPYGGGPGMILMAEPIVKAIKNIKISPFVPTSVGTTADRQEYKNIRIKKSKGKVSPEKKVKVVLLSPAGKQFDQKMAEKFSKLDQLIFICGRYEGIDARVEKIIDEKISIGPYILSGGELAAMVIIESVARLIPGYLGNPKSLKEETFIMSKNRKAEYPQYTRPEVIEINGKKHRVPKVLLSGNHQKIKEWKKSR